MTQERDLFPELEQFIGGGFHEDWGSFGATVEDVAQEYKSVAGPTRVRQACAEMDRFLDEYGANAGAAFEQRWGSFSPELMGYTIASFFEELKRILNEGTTP